MICRRPRFQGPIYMPMKSKWTNVDRFIYIYVELIGKSDKGFYACSNAFKTIIVDHYKGLIFCFVAMLFLRLKQDFRFDDVNPFLAVVCMCKCFHAPWISISTPHKRFCVNSPDYQSHLCSSGFLHELSIYRNLARRVIPLAQIWITE